MKRYPAAATALLVMALAWTAPSGSAERGDLEAAFRAWDKDGDGELTADEWRGKAPFERADGNGDGVVTLQELLGEPSDQPEVVATSQADELWPRMIKGWDGDGDGLLSASEWRGRTPHTSFDSDGDGQVTREEFSSAVAMAGGSEEARISGPSWERALEGWDKNDDGELAATEWSGHVPFDKLDADGNGRLTETEFRTALGFSADGADQPAPEKQPPSASSGEFELLLKAMDSNRDGRVSLDEWNGGTSDWEELDANGDGFITADEMH